MDLLPKKREREVSGSSFLDKVFQSTDSVSRLFLTGDKSEQDVLKQGDPFKSNSSFLGSLLKSTDSLFRSSSEKAKQIMFGSQDWKSDYALSHVDVPVQKVFDSTATSSSSSNPNESNKKDDWSALFYSQLPPAKPQQPQQNKKNSMDPPAPRPRKKAPSSVAKESAPSRPSKVASKKVFKEEQKDPVPDPTPSSKLTPVVSESTKTKSLEPNDKDVLMGRGGRTNNHPGNKRYLVEKDRIQPRYLKADKNEKTGISQELVDVVHGWGGRFLKLETDGVTWVEIDEKTARKKASQSLREINTPEVRAAKRAKYKH